MQRYGPTRNLGQASTSSVHGPLLSTSASTISSESFAVRSPGDLPSAVSSRIDIGTRHAFSAGYSNLQAQGTLGSNPLIFTRSPAGQIENDLPLLTRRGAPRPISRLILTSPANNAETNDEQDDHGTTYRSPSGSNDGSHRAAPECPSPQEEYQQERVSETHVPSFAFISDNYKPNFLVVDWEISLRETHSILSALRHSLHTLTIGPAPIIIQCPRPSTMEKIDISHLTSLTVDRGVDYAVLNELLLFAKMDKLRTLQLHADESQGVMPHELKIEWSQLTDVTLHGDLSPRALDGLVGRLRNVTRLEWSGDLIGTPRNEYSYNLHDLKTVSVYSNGKGCTFFLQSLCAENLRTLHLSHFSPLINGFVQQSLTKVNELSISSTKINVDQLLATLCCFPYLTTADFVVGDIKATDTDGWLSPITLFAQLKSLTLHSVSAPTLQPLLESIPLSRLHTLKITFNVSAEDQPFSGLVDWLQKESIPLKTLHLIGINMTQEELRSCLATVCSTLVDYYIELACFS